VGTDDAEANDISNFKTEIGEADYRGELTLLFENSGESCE